MTIRETTLIVVAVAIHKAIPNKPEIISGLHLRDSIRTPIDLCSSASLILLLNYEYKLRTGQDIINKGRKCVDPVMIVCF